MDWATPRFRKEIAMCHAWEYELIRKAYAEEMERRRRQEETAKRDNPSAPVPKPFDPQPQVGTRTPVPA
jgi:hypothetical protein